MRQKRSTLADVAALTGVSIKTISRALNNQSGLSEETRQRVLEVARQLEYIPTSVAHNIRVASSVVGLVVGELDDYVGQLVRGVSQVAKQNHYGLVLYTEYAVDEQAGSFLPLISSGLISGLVIIIPHYPEALIALMNTHDLPYVLIDYYVSDSPKENIPTITASNRKGIQAAMRYLVALGHRQIGFITSKLKMASACERLQGYQDVLVEVGLPFDPSLIAEIGTSPEDVFEETVKLLQHQPRPTAIIAWDDVTAIQAMAAIRQQGLEVGSDVSLIGFDDIPAASFVFPGLTTIRQPMIQMGEAGMDLLASLVKGVTPKNLHREFPTQLIIRQSTNPPKP